MTITPPSIYDNLEVVVIWHTDSQYLHIPNPHQRERTLCGLEIERRFVQRPLYQLPGLPFCGPCWDVFWALSPNLRSRLGVTYPAPRGPTVGAPYPRYGDLEYGD